jgi:hypothetical protein
MAAWKQWCMERVTCKGHQLYRKGGLDIAGASRPR